MPKVIACLALLASLVLSATAAAQPTPHPPGWVPVDQLPTVQSGRLGQPAAPVPGVAGATLFNAQLATEIGAILARLKKAKDECKPDDYQRALADWERVTRANQDLSTALAPGSIQDVTVRGRAHADDAVLNDLRNSRNFPRYYENCPPPPPVRDPAPDDATLPAFESGALGLPESPVAGTPIAVFDPRFAKKIAEAIEAMRKGVRDCNVLLYEAGYLTLRQAQQDRVNEGRPGPDRDPVSRAKADADARNIARWLEENWPRYPTPCDKRTGFLDRPPGDERFATFVTGGGSFALGGRSGAVTGVDSFLGPGERLIDNRLDGGASQGTGLLGVRVRAYATLFEGPEGPPVERGERPPPALSGIRGFFETGVQSSFGAASFTQNFSGVNAVPLGFGQQRINENFQIPIVIGVSLPVASGTRFDVYGGVALDSWTHTMSGGEAGAAGSSFFAAQNRFTVDPTVGVGLQIGLGRALGVPNLIAGVNAELQFRPGSVVTAPSSAFAAQTYYGTVNPAVNLQATARIGFAF